MLYQSTTILHLTLNIDLIQFLKSSLSKMYLPALFLTAYVNFKTNTFH